MGPVGFIIHQLANLLSEDKSKSLGLALQTIYRIAVIWFYFSDIILLSGCLIRTAGNADIVSSTICLLFLSETLGGELRQFLL